MRAPAVARRILDSLVYSLIMPCVFCGGAPVTNEHVFPQWLNRYLPAGWVQQIEQTRYSPGEYDITRFHVGLDFRIYTQGLRTMQ
jgi:hypothetical protein